MIKRADRPDVGFVLGTIGRGADLEAVPTPLQLPTLEALLGDPELTRPPDFIVPGLVERSAVTLLAGKPKVGKSTFVSQVAAAVTRGVHWSSGAPLPGGPGRVLWFAIDEPARRLVPRLGALSIDAAAVTLWTRDHGTLTAGAMAAQVAQLEPALVVVDTLSQLATDNGVDANDGNDVAPFLRPFVSVIHATRCGALFITHSPHHDNRAAGSVQWGAIPDGTLVFRPYRKRRPKGAEGRPDAGEDDDEDDPGNGDGRRIVEGVTRATGPLKLRLSYGDGRYREGDEQAPAEDRILWALRAGSSRGSALRDALSIREAAFYAAMNRLQVAELVEFHGKNKHDPRAVYALTERGRERATGQHTMEETGNGAR